ncbi:hypothetical protein C8J57DRAFT_1530556 [Mycena rebaudengoi]|nr:hypothetical protein C8J57DRAFT_1530556 [Mycena rebaudengoi]
MLLGNILLVYRPVLAGGWFQLNAVCNPGDNPSSDIVNISSIAALEETIFRNYNKQIVPMTFQNSNTSAMSGAAADAEWASFVPTNNGFLAKDIGNDTVHFGISAFHGMHCLDTLRRIFEVQFDVASLATISKLQANPEDNSFYHIHHCLIYLRSMILCNADPTLEHNIYSKNGSTTLGGDGTTHTCRDFNVLYAMSDASNSAAKIKCPAKSRAL